VPAATGARAQRTAQNRVALLAAAREVFLAEGYHGATVEQVAKAAGLTIGAVYSQFGGKAELFLALLEQRIEERAEQNRASLDSIGADGVRGLTRQWTRRQHDDLAWTLLVIEFRVHAARHPEVNERYAELHERTLDGIGAVFEAATQLPADEARRLGRALFTMGNGAALEQAVDGGDLDEADAADLVARVLGGVA
jgi:AcrR family transcriptional regulator